MRLIICLTIFTLSACVTQQPVILTEQLEIVPDPPIIADLYTSQTYKPNSIDEIYILSDEQKQKFFNAYNSAPYHKLLPNRRVSRYVQEELADFTFHWETLTASNAISTKTGNCLSMAIVTKALADLVDIEVKYELVASPPVYQKAGDVVLISQHVRTILLNPEPIFEKGYFTLWRGGVKIDYFPSVGNIRLRRVKDPEFLTMYFINKAAEALGENKDALAFANLQRNLRIDKTEPQTVNM
ncbi:MAG: hypothetical protein L3J46_01060 [Kangiellaceae bacterium]|nr:hypothetical protein [Kangiellaceae bacterium]